ncbi:MAG TPA: HlyU family transcriptional regulator [Microvirga sp.]|jgi:hypothetical protein|nr:HlyU family transcriptional regulator [Microvirga sp.]
MFLLKNLFARFGGARAEAPEAPAEAVEYKGYRIRPAPFRDGGQFQTCGTIEKDTADGLREHRFVRAEKHPSRDDAVAFSLMKAKQIIDQQGDRLFGERQGPGGS